MAMFWQRDAISCYSHFTGKQNSRRVWVPSVVWLLQMPSSKGAAVGQRLIVQKTALRELFKEANVSLAWISYRKVVREWNFFSCP